MSLRRYVSLEVCEQPGNHAPNIGAGLDYQGDATLEEAVVVHEVQGRVRPLAFVFGGDDPLLPVMRAVHEKTRRDLTLLHRAFNEEEPLELPEPDGEEMELARKYFDNGLRLMGGL